MRSIHTFRVFLRTPVSHSCAQGRLIRDFMLDYVTTPRSDLACPPSVSVRRGGQYEHFVFLGFCGHPWLLQSCPHCPYWGSLGVLKLLPWTTRVAHLVPSRSHRVLYVITLDALTASRVAHLFPSRATGCSEWSLGSYPGTELVPHGLSDSSF